MSCNCCNSDSGLYANAGMADRRDVDKLTARLEKLEAMLGVPPPPPPPPPKSFEQVLKEAYSPAHMETILASPKKRKRGRK